MLINGGLWPASGIEGTRALTRAIAVGCLAFVVLASLSSAARTSEDRYDFHIEGGTLESVMGAFVDTAGVAHFYPHDLAKATGFNPVIGRYTIEEALAILLDGTRFSSGLTKSGVIVISLDRAKEQDREGEHVAEGKIRKSLLASLSALLLGTASDGTRAQEGEGADTDVLDVIVVTAQKRSQSLQDVPFSLLRTVTNRPRTIGLRPTY